jgi:hypothetical protein
LYDPSQTGNNAPLARAVMYAGASWTLAPTPATAASPAAINLEWEVGDLQGTGTAAGQVSHVGVASNRAMAMIGAPVLADFNTDSDGMMDIAVLQTASQVAIRYGRNDINTANAAETAANDDAWAAVAATVTDLTELVTGGGTIANAIAMAAGDVNGDTYADLVVLEATAGAGGDNVRLILGEGSSAATPFANQATRTRAYPVNASNGDLTGSVVEIGDVTGDSIDDIVIGARNFDIGADASVGDGIVMIIYGAASLPVDGTTMANVAQAPTGLSIPNPDGTGNADNFGGVIAIGNFDDAGPDDIVVGATATITTNAVRVYSGGNPVSAGPIAQYSVENAGDLAGGTLLLADIDGMSGPDLIVGARAFNNGAANDGKVYILSNGTPDGPLTQASVVYMGAAAAAAGIGSSLAVLDFTGDGTDDLLIGATGGGFVDVAAGPVNSNITVLNLSQRLVGAAGVGSAILYGDVSNDATEDLIIANDAGNCAGMLLGLR